MVLTRPGPGKSMVNRFGRMSAVLSVGGVGC
jgi:hypothetical protein